MKDTYSVKDLQRETAAAIRTAESGTLVTVTRHDRPVVHVISAARLGGLLESMELLADDKFSAASPAPYFSSFSIGFFLVLRPKWWTMQLKHKQVHRYPSRVVICG